MLLVALFQNLIGNAIKFAAPGQRPAVNISVASDDTFWQFTCTDNGIGIEPQHAEKIFVIFQRLHSRDRYPGTGIGLAMCRKIIEYHGGRIWLDTDTATDGTSLRFTLPKDVELNPPSAAGAAVRSSE